jgi:pyridoxine 5-phosphate synthase
VIRLGVNIDHVATLRQARRTYEPDPVAAAALSELAGADGITIHLREDRRHIQDRDLEILRRTVTTRLNLEMAAVKEIVDIALKIKPDQVTLVPEKRAEVTTEGGLNLIGQEKVLGKMIDKLQKAGIPVSLFLDPEPKQIEAAARLHAYAVELHTGSYAEAFHAGDYSQELLRLQDASRRIVNRKMHLHAGHGLNYQNVIPVAKIPHMEELNIGHSIISRAVLIGISQAVREMKCLIVKGCI